MSADQTRVAPTSSCSTAVYPMTVEQESMWLDDYLTDGPCRYLESWVYRLTGSVDRRAVRLAWEGIVARHEALRSCFGLLDGDDPVQRVQPPGRLPPLAVRPCPAAEVERTLRELVSAPLDLTRQAVRATLLAIDDDSVILVVQMHHIVLDDWALHVLEREFEEHYRAHVEGRPVALEPVPLQPGPYAERQRSTPRDPAVAAYWRARLAGLATDLRTSLPADACPTAVMPVAPTSPAPTGRGARAEFAVGPDITRGLRRLCRTLRVTPFTVFAAATALLLHSAGAGEDLVIATPVSRRGTEELDGMIAPLSELLPLRLHVPSGTTFAELVSQARARTHEAIKFRDISAPELSRFARRRGRTPPGLCQTSLVLDDAADGGMRLPGVAAERLFVFSGRVKFDLCFFLTAAGPAYTGMLDYNADRYSPATAQHWIQRLLELLDRAVSEPNCPIAALV